MHISLDGFVAGAKGELDWVHLDPELFEHVGIGIRETDTALYGRVTYQMMESYWPTVAENPAATQHDIDHSKWYKEAHKIVLSRTMDKAYNGDVQIINENLRGSINELKGSSEGKVKDILVFGSPTAIHSLIEQNLIDGYWLFVNPVILGDGIPLFKNVKEKTKLRLTNSRTLSSGVVELNYLVDKSV